MNRSTLLSALMLLALSLTGCDTLDRGGPAGAHPTTRYGPAVSVGAGTARLFVTTNDAGAPASLGLALTEAALESLPEEETVFELDLPAGVSVAPFDHATLDWNPHGHEPPDIYGLPHFDFHFYMLSREDRAQIPGGPDTTTVPAGHVPENYISTVQSFPNMGVHWADADARELHGATFDKTLLYGFSDGAMVFIEPMITTAFLASRPDVSLPIRQPAAFRRSGRYPTAYSIRYDALADEYRIALDDLTLH